MCKYTGEFGIVYKSHLLQTKDGDDITFVAVKTLKGDQLVMWYCKHEHFYKDFTGSYDTDAVNDLVQESIKNNEEFSASQCSGLAGGVS